MARRGIERGREEKGERCTFSAAAPFFLSLFFFLSRFPIFNKCKFAIIHSSPPYIMNHYHLSSHHYPHPYATTIRSSQITHDISYHPSQSTTQRRSAHSSPITFHTVTHRHHHHPFPTPPFITTTHLRPTTPAHARTQPAQRKPQQQKKQD